MKFQGHQSRRLGVARVKTGVLETRLRAGAAPAGVGLWVGWAGFFVATEAVFLGGNGVLIARYYT